MKVKKLKATIRNLIRSTANRFYEPYYNFKYSNNAHSALQWDGSHEGFIDLLFSLINPIISRSIEKKKTFIIPPIFQTSVHRKRVEKAETFSRSFIGAAYFLKAKKDKQELDEKFCKVLKYYRNGIVEAMNPKCSNFWGYDNHFLLENTSIIVGLLVSENIIWSTYSTVEKEIILAYLESYIDEVPYNNNWLWTKVFHVAFLNLYRANKGKNSIRSLLEAINDMHVGKGWYTDGDKQLNSKIDYYNAWSFHYYGQIFAKYFSASFPLESSKLIARAKEYIESYQYFFTIGGTHPIYGRSQLYKFATLAPFGYVINQEWRPSNGYGYLRQSLVDNVNVFLSKGGVSSSGFVTMGVTNADKDTLEHYSASGSPYWIFKAFSLLLIESTHSFWTSKVNINQSDENICSIQEIGQIVARDGKGGCVLYTQPAYEQGYRWKYGKLAFPNISNSKPDFNVFRSDNSVWLNEQGKNTFNNKVIRRECNERQLTTVWQYEDYPHLLIQTDIIVSVEGYVFVHQLCGDKIKPELKFEFSGFAIFNGKDSFDFPKNKALGSSKNNRTIESYLSIIHSNTDYVLYSKIEKKSRIPIAGVNTGKYTCIIGYCSRRPTNIAVNLIEEDDKYTIFIHNRKYIIRNIGLI